MDRLLWSRENCRECSGFINSSNPDYLRQVLLLGKTTIGSLWFQTVMILSINHAHHSMIACFVSTPILDTIIAANKLRAAMNIITTNTLPVPPITKFVKKERQFQLLLPSLQMHRFQAHAFQLDIIRVYMRIPFPMLQAQKRNQTLATRRRAELFTSAMTIDETAIPPKRTLVMVFPILSMRITAVR